LINWCCRKWRAWLLLYLVFTTAMSKASKLGLRSPIIPSASVSRVGLAMSSWVNMKSIVKTIRIRISEICRKNILACLLLEPQYNWFYLCDFYNVVVGLIGGISKFLYEWLTRSGNQECGWMGMGVLTVLTHFSMRVLL
jgi:hypothetical protein